MFLKNAQEKASQGAQLSKAYLQDVGDSIFGTVTSPVQTTMEIGTNFV
jgi:hypothetical protein